jgi:hypothetical protein
MAGVLSPAANLYPLNYNNLSREAMQEAKARLYKTARATISCALFKAGQIVAVRFFNHDVNGKAWFEVSPEKFPATVPPLYFKSTFYPENHLSEFVL